MDSTTGTVTGDETTVTARFWASAREAAGVESVSLPVSGALPLPEVVRAVVADAEARRGAEAAARLARVLGVCSVLVGDRRADRDDVSALVAPGQSVEFLPPFAGG